MPRLRIPRPSSLADLFDRACLVLTLLLLTAASYRRFVQDAVDPNKCEALLQTGQWLDSPDHDPPQAPYRNWQAPGCMLHEYKTPDIAKCNENGKILFVGDASARQIFWAAVRKLDSGYVTRERKKIDQHDDINFSKNGANLKFLWDPWLNSSGLYEELARYRQRREPGFKEEEEEDDTYANSGSRLESEVPRSVAILISGGLWHARHSPKSGVQRFRDAVENITATAFSSGTPTSLRTAPLSDREGVQDQVFFAPILEPRYELLSPGRESTIVPEKIDNMNDHLRELSLHHGLNVVWSFTNMTRGILEAYGESGIHVRETFSARMIDILLNLRCNAKAAAREGYPFDRTCCSGYRPMNLVQTLALLGTIVVVLVVILKSAKVRQRSNSISANATASVSVAILTLMLYLCYCFIADRTHVLPKVQQQYAVLDFRVIFLVLFLGCAVWIKGAPSSPGRRRADSFSGTVSPQSFLPRSQTDEWKGWMQVYILVYTYTAASSELDFYEVLRILIACYLFMTGYGHTMYFLQTQDYSLQRLVAVLSRLNLLAVSLSFVMGRPYSTYSFAPLVSFWFLVVYVTLKFSCHRNDKLLFLVGKVAVSGLLVTVFVHANGVLELVSFVLGTTFRATWEVQKWRDILSVDIYIALVGMLVAIIHLRVHSVLATHSRSNIFTQTLTDHFPVIRGFFIFLASITLPIFWMLTRRSPNRADYDWWMPILGWLPVVSFAILRNCHQFLRQHHSVAFAWIGRISLEIYLLSQHVLLAGDGNGLLGTGFFKGDGTIKGDRWRDLVVLSIVFVWGCWRVAAATATITSWISGVPDKREVEILSKAPSREDDLAFPEYGNGFQPSLSRGERREMEAEKRNSRWAGDLRLRLIVLGAGIWVCSIVS